MMQTISTTLGPVRLLGENATPIWGMSNAERNRRMAESAAKNGSTLAPGHELVLIVCIMPVPSAQNRG